MRTCFRQGGRNKFNRTVTSVARREIITGRERGKEGRKKRISFRAKRRSRRSDRGSEKFAVGSSEIICEAMKRRLWPVFARPSDYPRRSFAGAKEGRRGNEAGRRGGARFVDERGIARTPLEERRKVAEMLFRRLRASFIAWEIALGR